MNDALVYESDLVQVTFDGGFYYVFDIEVGACTKCRTEAQAVRLKNRIEG